MQFSKLSFLPLSWGGRFTRAFTAQDGKMRLDLDALSLYTRVQAPNVIEP